MVLGKIASAARNWINSSPKQKRQPLPFLLSISFFYDATVSMSLSCLGYIVIINFDTKWLSQNPFLLVGVNTLNFYEIPKSFVNVKSFTKPRIKSTTQFDTDCAIFLQSWAQATTVATIRDNIVTLPLNIVTKLKCCSERENIFRILACPRNLSIRCCVVALLLVACPAQYFCMSIPYLATKQKKA